MKGNGPDAPNSEDQLAQRPDASVTLRLPENVASGEPLTVQSLVPSAGWSCASMIPGSPLASHHLCPFSSCVQIFVLAINSSELVRHWSAATRKLSLLPGRTDSEASVQTWLERPFALSYRLISPGSQAATPTC